MEVMPPGNSFPQICVVSVNHSVPIVMVACDQYCSKTSYERSMDKSNNTYSLMSNEQRTVLRAQESIQCIDLNHCI
jgi:hypothetical protein